MGHTPTSPGAGRFLNELAEDRKIGAALIAELQRRGHTVVNTTPPDSVGYPSEINQRVATANRSGASLFCSIHLNAGGGTGVEVLHYPGDATGVAIASQISANLSTLLGLPNRGPKARDNIGVIVNTTMTAVLVEVCFVDSTADADSYRRTSTASIASAIADGLEKRATSGGGGSAPAPNPQPKPENPGAEVHVHYGLHQLGGDWLGEITDFNNANSEGFAGVPNCAHDMLYARVDRGTLKYRVKTAQDGWLPWVSRGDKNDTVNACAGIFGHAITGVQIYYTTPSGETLKQAWYRSQTTRRAGWLPVCCDDGTSYEQFDGWAGMDGEPLDRLQIKIASANPF